MQQVNAQKPLMQTQGSEGNLKKGSTVKRDNKYILTLKACQVTSLFYIERTDKKEK